MANNVGTLITAEIRPQSDIDTIATAFANEIRGGWHNVASIAERDAIYTDRKQEGMSCYVLETSGAYIWSGGQWSSLTAGADGKANLVGGNTFYGDQTIWGSINVSGSLNYISTQELLIEDNYVVTNSTVTGAPNLDSGLKVNRGTLTDTVIKFNESTDKWQAGLIGSEENIIVSSDLNSYTLLSTTASISGDLQSQISAITVPTSATFLTDYDNRYVNILNISGGGGSLTVSDGITTISNVTTIDFNGATITDNGGGSITVDVSGGGGGISQEFNVAQFTATSSNVGTPTEITLNAALYTSGDILLEGFGKIMIPTGMQNGQSVSFLVTQSTNPYDWTLQYETGILFSSGIPTPVSTGSTGTTLITILKIRDIYLATGLVEFS